MKRIFGLFSKENSVRGASIILIVTLALSNILGLFRDRFLAKNILTYDLDIYYASFRIPDLIFNLLILGAISSAFIPIFSDYRANKKLKEGFLLANNLLNIALLFMIVSAILFIILMPYIMPLVVPKFGPDRLSETIKLSRLVMLTPIFFAISYIVSGMLNTFNRFLAYSLAPLVYNLSIIFGAAFLAPRYGLISVVYCVVLGSALHILVQIPSVLKLGYRYKLILNLRDVSIKRIIRLMVPRTIGMGVNQLMLIIFTAIASTLAAGSIAAFELSNNIQTMPIVVFGTSFATAVFPTLTLKAAMDEKESFGFYLSRGMRTIGFLLIPSSIIFFLLRAQIIRLILGSGKFSWQDTRMTAMTLGLFSISLLVQGLIPLLSRAFYALKNTKTPMYLSIITVVFSGTIAYPLASYFGVAGLALAFSLGNFLNALLLTFYLKKIYREVWSADILNSYTKIIFISVIMGLAVWGTMHLASGFVDMTRFFGLLTQTFSSIFVGAVLYLGLAHIFKCQEFKWIISRKLKGEKDLHKENRTEPIAGLEAEYETIEQ